MPLTTPTTTNRHQVTQTAISDARGTIADVHAVGGRVVRLAGLETEGGIRPVVLAEVPDSTAALKLLALQVRRAAEKPEIADMARRMRAAFPGDAECAQALHSWMRATIGFQREAGEIFQRPTFTAQRGLGDCDCQTLLLGALGVAAGLPTRLMPFRVAGEEPQHIAVQFGHDGAWHDAETTIAARYGEDPIAAIERLRPVGREDLGP